MNPWLSKLNQNSFDFDLCYGKKNVGYSNSLSYNSIFYFQIENNQFSNKRMNKWNSQNEI